MAIKINQDGFVWLVVSHEQAMELLISKTFELYKLYDDDSEGWVVSEEELIDAQKKGIPIGIEVGFINEKSNMAITEDKSNMAITEDNLTKVNHDVNGNPRYVVHFMRMLSSEEQKTVPLDKAYDLAVRKARKIGGKRFHNKQYGGGIVFQSYNVHELVNSINALILE